ncbi:hypothetical protein, partial [Mesorhizobium waimense]|uniref:hypothetical protein n=1 Tax=Mesorhizobium waimense TaxID=1300307 RepID=UPI001ABFB126
VALGLLGDLGHPATALFGPHPQLESQTSLRRNPNFPIFQTASYTSRLPPSFEVMFSNVRVKTSVFGT